MKVKCIDNDIDTTLNKIYKVINETTFAYWFVDDSGHKNWKYKTHFKVVKEKECLLEI